jgi:hypothetical protein
LVTIKDIVEKHNVDYLLTSIASNLPQEMIEQTLNELEQLYGDKQIFIGGNCIQSTSVTLPKNITSFNTLDDFGEFLSKI